MLSSLNFYYAIPGNESAVLRQRLRACEVRLELGVPRGRVIERTSGAGELPDVVWELVFSDITGHHADMAVRADSPAFEEVRAGMRKLCRRFERPLFEVCEDTVPARGDGAAATISWDWIFCAPGGVDETLRAVRETAAHAAAAPAKSRVLRLVTEGADLPAVLWQREYAQGVRDEALERALKAECGRLGARVEPSRWAERQ